MQSLASLMSWKQSDIGNLDDFNDSDEEEDKRLSAAVKMATAVIGNTDTHSQSYICILMYLEAKTRSLETSLETGISCSERQVFMHCFLVLGELAKR